MIITYKGSTIVCTVDEAIEFFKKIDNESTKSNIPNTVYPHIDNDDDDCDKCPFKPKENDDTVGDNACTFCIKRKVMCTGTTNTVTFK